MDGSAAPNAASPSAGIQRNRRRTACPTAPAGGYTIERVGYIDDIIADFNVVCRSNRARARDNGQGKDPPDSGHMSLQLAGFSVTYANACRSGSATDEALRTGAGVGAASIAGARVAVPEGGRIGGEALTGAGAGRAAPAVADADEAARRVACIPARHSGAAVRTDCDTVQGGCGLPGSVGPEDQSMAPVAFL